MYYPLMIDLKDKNIIVIGGGKVAFRKSKKLLEYEGNVTVISPEFIKEFKYLKREYDDRLNIIQDYYSSKYIYNAYLVIAATSHKIVNKDISIYCKENKILCNVVNDINSSNFIVPSSLKRGDLVISISTMGKSPMLASKIKKELEEQYSDIYEDYLYCLGEARDIVLKKFNGNDKKEILKSLINMSLDEIKRFIKDNI